MAPVYVRIVLRTERTLLRFERTRCNVVLRPVSGPTIQLVTLVEPGHRHDLRKISWPRRRSFERHRQCSRVS